MSARHVSDIAARLNAAAAELAPRLLPGGQRAGTYWQAGNIQGEGGKSLYLQLNGPNAGKWRDAATGDRGDLLDLIRHQNGCSMAEAARIGTAMLGDPTVASAVAHRQTARRKQPRPDARRAVAALWARSRPIAGTHGEAYMAARGIDAATIAGCDDLRFLDEARTKEGTKTFVLPAMLAAVRNAAGEITGLHRTFLSAAAPKKANIEDPKKALGRLHGGGAYLAPSGKCLVIAEGIETALSVKTAFPGVALIAALTAPHMEVLVVPDGYRRIMIAADLDVAGLRAAAALANRLADQGRAARIITPADGEGDFNDLLMAGGVAAVRARVRAQLNITG